MPWKLSVHRPPEPEAYSRGVTPTIELTLETLEHTVRAGVVAARGPETRSERNFADEFDRRGEQADDGVLHFEGFRPLVERR